MCEMLPRWRSAEYIGLMAAPGTPKACVTPSFSITSTAACTAFIFAMGLSPLSDVHCRKRGAFEEDGWGP
jgi:hypothetical protein